MTVRKQGKEPISRFPANALGAKRSYRRPSSKRGGGNFQEISNVGGRCFGGSKPWWCINRPEMLEPMQTDIRRENATLPLRNEGGRRRSIDGPTEGDRGRVRDQRRSGPHDAKEN